MQLANISRVKILALDLQMLNEKIKIVEMNGFCITIRSEYQDDDVRQLVKASLLQYLNTRKSQTEAELVELGVEL